MKHTIVITKVLLLLLSTIACSAQKAKKDSLFHGWKKIDYQKEIIYLKFEKNNGKFPEYRCKKFKNNTGIVFNMCKNGSLLFSKKFKSDTLDIKYLSKYKTVSVVDVKKKVKEFRDKTYKKLPLKYTDELYQAYDNNDIFETFLIEIISQDKFVIYPVIWRNQGIAR